MAPELGKRSGQHASSSPRQPKGSPMNDITAQPAPDTESRKGKRRPIIAFALAALAVGGIGAAATSAAWTDNVFFSAQAESATFNLQGSIDGGGTWQESN